MIINKDKISQSSLDKIYGEIINLSVSVGECKASIDHNESLLYRIHDDLKHSIEKINTKVTKLEHVEDKRQSRYQFIWKILGLSPGNIFKWMSIIVLSASLLMGFSQRISELFQFATG